VFVSLLELYFRLKKYDLMNELVLWKYDLLTSYTTRTFFIPLFALMIEERTDYKRSLCEYYESSSCTFSLKNKFLLIFFLLLAILKVLGFSSKRLFSFNLPFACDSEWLATRTPQESALASMRKSPGLSSSKWENLVTPWEIRTWWSAPSSTFELYGR